MRSWFVKGTDVVGVVSGIQRRGESKEYTVKIKDATSPRNGETFTVRSREGEMEDGDPVTFRVFEGSNEAYSVRKSVATQGGK